MSRGGRPGAPEGRPDELLRLVYADASPLATGAWRLSLGFDPAGTKGRAIRPVPPEAVHVRPVDDLRHARPRVTRTAWAIPGATLTVDASLHGNSTVAGAYLVKIDCPDLVDPAANSARFAAPGAPDVQDAVAPPIDYLTKDYLGFRRLMLDAINRVLPAWNDGSEADLGVTVVESLAYAADFLSYHQDAVATEAYLDTARQRTSIRRHLRLLGHRLSEGCAGRLLMRVTVRPGGPVEIPAGTVYVAAPELPPVTAADDPAAARAVADGRTVYTQIETAVMRPELNRLELFPALPLRAGRVHFPVLAPAAMVPRFDALASGRIFGVGGKRTAEAGPVMHPFRVREVECTKTSVRDGRRLYILLADPDDALPWDLHVDDDTAVTGNLALAEFGRMVREDLPVRVSGSPYRPALTEPFVVPVVPIQPGASAAALLSPKADRAVAAVTLREVHSDGGDPSAPEAVWHPALDLLESTGRARRFVVETDDEGIATLRFGDATFGRQPPTLARLVAEYRIGALATATVGEGRLDRLVAASREVAEALRPRVRDVANTLPSKALAHADPEDRAIMLGKAGFRVNLTCVTLADFEAAAAQVAGVAEAVATVDRAGSADAIVVKVRANGDLFIADTLLRRVRQAIEGRMLPGRRLAVRGPRFARLSLAVAVRPLQGFEAGEVRRAIETALSTRPGSVFAPDALAFGRPVFASRIVEAVSEVPGVAGIRVARLSRVAWADPRNLARSQEDEGRERGGEHARSRWARGGGSDALPPALIGLAPDEIPVLAHLSIHVEAS